MPNYYYFFHSNRDQCNYETVNIIAVNLNKSNNYFNFDHSRLLNEALSFIYDIVFFS